MRDIESVKPRLARHAAGLACAVLLLTPLPGAAMEPCGTPSGGTPSGSIEAACASAPDLARSMLKERVDRTLAIDPAQERGKTRLTVTPSAASPAQTAPFALMPDGDRTNFTTSLSQWGSAFSAADIRVLEQAKTEFGQDIAMPKTLETAGPAFDVWAQTRHEAKRLTGESAKQGDILTSYVGADYRLQSNLLFGAMLQLDEAKQSFSPAHDGISAAAYLAGPYVAYRLTPNVTLGARAAWGTANDSTFSASDAASFATSRKLTEAHIAGNWDWGKWQVGHVAAVTYMDETAIAILPGPGETSVAVTRLTTGPELKRQIDTGLGSSLEPFAFFKTSLELDEAKIKPGATRNTVGGGVMLSKPESYSIRATAEHSESVGEVPDEAVAGKVSVSVPLP